MSAIEQEVQAARREAVEKILMEFRALYLINYGWKETFEPLVEKIMLAFSSSKA